MSDHVASLLQPEEEVLSTLNRDGTRKWLKPKISAGRFLTRRQWIGYGLIAAFAAMPTLRMNGKPLMLLDVAHRQFTFFGHTFLPTDTALLALLMLSLFVGVFLITALLGRVWCGYACPQTVYMELVYRPVERWLDGTLGKGGRPSRPRGAARTFVLFSIYFAISLALAHIFLAYFVSLDELFKWMQRSPLEHPQSFILVLVTTGLTMFNFVYFREQTCLVACPYGRFQSVLLDRDSLIVSYDTKRGEPRGRLRKNDVSLPVVSDRGDCIDCGLCVVTCPTGIDIRKGLQMECVACAQCIDACDTVMEKIGKPLGLIRYSSQRILGGEARRIVRPRVVVYSIAILATLTALTTLLINKGTADVTLLRGKGLPFNTLPGGEISNPLQLKVINRTAEAAGYSMSVSGKGSPCIIADQNPLMVAPWQYRTEPILIAIASEAFVNGKAHVEVTVSDGRGFERTLGYELLGPYGSPKPASAPATSHAKEAE